MSVYPREKHCQDVEREDYQHFESFSCSSHALLHHCDCVESFDCYRYASIIKTKVSFQLIWIFFPVMFNNTMGWRAPHHSTNFLDKLSLTLGLQEHVYTVVIDAGSTGSRVLAFTFHRSLSGENLFLYTKSVVSQIVFFFQIEVLNSTRNSIRISNRVCLHLLTTPRKEQIQSNSFWTRPSKSCHKLNGTRHLWCSKQLPDWDFCQQKRQIWLWRRFEITFRYFLEIIFDSLTLGTSSIWRIWFHGDASLCEHHGRHRRGPLFLVHHKFPARFVLHKIPFEFPI